MFVFRNWKRFTRGLGVLGIGLVLGTAVLSRPPNVNLVWHQSVPTPFAPERLGKHLASLNRWPQWFHHLQKVERLSPLPSSLSTQEPPPDLFLGALLRLHLRVKNRQPFQVDFHVEEYLPEKRLRLRLVADSSQKLTRAFQQLTWEIGLHPGQVTGKVEATPQRWQSRLWGRLAPSILLYHAFSPDLFKLAQKEYAFDLPHRPAGNPWGGSL